MICSGGRISADWAWFVVARRMPRNPESCLPSARAGFRTGPEFVTKPTGSISNWRARTTTGIRLRDPAAPAGRRAPAARDAARYPP